MDNAMIVRETARKLTEMGHEKFASERDAAFFVFHNCEHAPAWALGVAATTMKFIQDCRKPTAKMVKALDSAAGLIQEVKARG